MNNSSIFSGRVLVLSTGVALAVIGAVFVWIVLFGILSELGANDGQAVGLSFLIWVAGLTALIVGLVRYYNSSKAPAEQVTIVREVVTLLLMPELPIYDPSQRQAIDPPAPPNRPQRTYRSTLLEGDQEEGKLN